MLYKIFKKVSLVAVDESCFFLFQINLIGHSQDHEIVVVDSFKYIASPTVDWKKDNLNMAKVYEPDELLGNIHEEIDLLFDDGSGEGSGEEYDLHLGDELEEDDLDEKGVTKIEE